MNDESEFARAFLDESIEILRAVDTDAVDAMAGGLRATRDRRGRLFCCGSGGGAGFASHATSDFRTLAGIEAYCVSDNVSELTARVNDDGWSTSYANWLRASNLSPNDALFIFSVSGGDEPSGLSMNLVRAIETARDVGAGIMGISGRADGMLAQSADICIVIPTADPRRFTAQTEGLQAILWHLLVSHPRLAVRAPTWESMDGRA